MRLVRIGRPRTLCLLGGDSKSAAMYVVHSVHLTFSFSRRKDASDAMEMTCFVYQGVSREAETGA
jgi:hypothetical protein